MTNDRYLTLYAKTTLDGILAGSSSSWPRVGNPRAVPLNYGFPFPESFPNKDLTSALAQAFESEPGRVLQYGSGEVAGSLTGFLVKRAAVRGMAVTEDQVVITSGSSQAIDMICRIFLDRGDVIMMEAPTFMGALRTFRNFTVSCVGFPMDEQGLQTAALEDDLARRKRNGLPLPKFFYTIPNFQNPMGVTMSLDRRRELLRLAREYGFLLVEDDAYGELRFQGEDVPTLQELDTEGCVLHVGTFSKVIGPGVRMAWVFAPKAIAAQLERVKAGSTNGLAQSAVAQYCNTVDFDQRVAWLRDEYRSRRDAMLQALQDYMPEGVTWTRPDGGFFIWAELPERLNAHELLAEAAQKGVAYLGGEMFFPDGSGSNCIRLSFSYADGPELRRGIEVLSHVVRGALGD